MPLPLISPFPTTVAHLHPRPSSSIRIPYRHLCCRCGRTHFLFLCRLLRSAATPFGLCPRSFLHNPPLGFVRPLPSTTSFTLSRLGFALGRSICSPVSSSLHTSHAPGRCLEFHTHVESFPVTLNSYKLRIALSSSPTSIAWTITSRHFTNLDRQRCQLDCSLYIFHPTSNRVNSRAPITPTTQHAVKRRRNGLADPIPTGGILDTDAGLCPAPTSP